MHTYFLYMKSHNLWMCSKDLKLKLKINLTKESRVSDLTMMVNTMADMMVQVNNVRGLLPGTYRNVESSHSTPCRGHLT